MILDEIAAYLSNVSGLSGVTIVKGLMPATPDVVLSLHEYGGSPPIQGFGVPGIQHEMPGVQVRVRGPRPGTGGSHEYTTPRTVMETAYQALSQIQGATLSGTFYLMAHPQQSPFILERDENARVVFAVNVLFEKELSA
jgi:hypothetical protein